MGGKRNEGCNQGLMVKRKSYLGIDTSNYMTSICFINEDREIIYEGKKLLEVKLGEKGLQQSQAMFQHIKNLPELFKQATNIEQYQLEAIAVSKGPRPEEGSYMPVFLAGVAVAESMASVLNIPIIYTTHQEGHIAAGIHSADKKIAAEKFLAVHLSGGTSEVLEVRNIDRGYEINIIGGTLDLHAGQLIDRIGVLLGYPFPAGPSIENFAKKSADNFKRIPTSIREFSFHFSGAEAEAKRRLAKNESPEDIARAIEHHIAASITKVLSKALESGYPKDILIVGGVAQNQYIRNYFIKQLEHPRLGGRLFFAHKNYSGDNAFGVANIGFTQLFLNK